MAQLVVDARPPITRAIDLGDVEPDLAPRVVAVVLAAVLEPAPAAVTVEPAPAPVTVEPAPAPVTVEPAPPTAGTTPPSAATPSPAPGFVAPRTDDVPAAAVAAHRPRRPTLLHDRRLRLGAGARALARAYRGSGGTLWGLGLSVTVGPATVGVLHARSTVEHDLGTLSARVTAVDVSATVACTRDATTTCVGARVEVGRGTISAVATDPSSVGGELSSLEAHAAAELTIAREVRGLELAGVLALGAGAGVVARANGVEAARLAGWTLGAALEVRR